MHLVDPNSARLIIEGATSSRDTSDWPREAREFVVEDQTHVARAPNVNGSKV